MQPASSAAQPGLSELPPSIDSAEQPAVNPQDAEMDSIAEQHALAGSSTDRAGVQDDLAAGEDHVLAELRERQRKRAIESEVEEQRPLAKPKAAKRQNKRTAGTASGSVEQPASKRKEQRLTAESFAACAAPPIELEHCEPASSSSGAQPAQQRSRRMYGRRKELKKLSTTAWIVEDAAKELKRLIDAAYSLRQIPAKKRSLDRPIDRQALQAKMRRPPVSVRTFCWASPELRRSDRHCLPSIGC